jgi:hypothetical protein
MRVALCALACLLMAGCNVPPQPKPSPYRYLTSERTEARSPSCPVSTHL